MFNTGVYYRNQDEENTFCVQTYETLQPKKLLSYLTLFKMVNTIKISTTVHRTASTYSGRIITRLYEFRPRVYTLDSYFFKVLILRW